tara:strand:- start:1601 stop:1891 length:291 start_codon:yes stop_codon:yes gene_type:complete
MKLKFILLLFILTSCGTFQEAGKAMRNEKTRTTDEFLIEKRGPLSTPPKMGELPKPNANGQDDRENQGVLGSIKEKTISEEKSELENILLEEIRKN